MQTEILIYILIGLLLFGGAMYLLKSLVKAALLTVVIMVLFRVGWIYSAEEMVNTFRLDKILNKESYTEFRIGYEDYVNKREEDPIVNPKGLEETIKSEIQNKVYEYFDSLKKDENN